jgi:hypothetical protein
LKSPVSFVENSKNVKIGNIAATYAPIEQTCPDSCKLKDSVCYAQTSFVGIHNARLTKAARKGRYTALQLARMEAATIDKASGDPRVLSGSKRLPPLRLHVSGDSRTIGGTKRLASAAKRYIKRTGSVVYSYTHSWKTVPRAAWGEVSILASVDDFKQAKQALKKGYAPAIVVETHPEDGKAWQFNGMNVIPCPSQTRGVTCETCKLCMKDQFLKNSDSVIAFAAHGVRKNKFKLKVIS